VTCLDAVSTTCAEQEISLKGNPDYVSAECIENNARCKCTFKSIDSAESGLLWKVEGIKLFDKNGSSNWDDGDDFMVDGDVFVRRGKTDKIMSYSIYERL